MASHVITNNRNRRKATPAKPRTGAVPSITAVAAVGIGQPNDVQVTFDIPTVVDQVPRWTTLGLSPNLTAAQIVSSTSTSVVIGFGAPVAGLTGINVPQSNSDARSNSGSAVPPGDYLV